MKYLILAGLIALYACASKNSDDVVEESKAELEQSNPEAADESNLLLPGEEAHLSNVRQLTFGNGDNAEAYFSPSDSKIVWQKRSEEEDILCDQIFAADLNEDGLANIRQISRNGGRTTCSYFVGEEHIIFASTHEVSIDCPVEPSKDEGYVWPLYPSFELFKVKANGSGIVKLTQNNYYDAEATVSPDGQWIVYTSLESGDLELYIMRVDGSEKRQITHDLGYDGGAFFSPDGSKLIWRSSRPTTDAEVAEYKALLAKDLVKPSHMELYWCNVDGSNITKITDLGGANWAPFFHPSGEKVVFSSNHESERGFPFNIYMINLDGSGLEQITFDESFNAFPMFSYKGDKLIFASNRTSNGGRSTNLFIADWHD